MSVLLTCRVDSYAHKRSLPLPYLGHKRFFCSGEPFGPPLLCVVYLEK
jgi:hypothetical protein